MKRVRSQFVTHLSDVFVDFGPVSARRMFGGYGVYHGDVMFGLVADDILYLKADAESEPHFSIRSLDQFEFVKNGKPVRMSYFMAPGEIFEDRSEAKKWAAMAYEAALRNKRKSRKRK